MATVLSFGALQRSTPVPPLFFGGYAGGAVQLYESTISYAQIYASQPNVRTCVDFLARNVAQLGIHVYRRVTDTDRVRLPDHDISNWLEHPTPNPALTRYRLIENLVGDLGIYFNAFWLKVPWVDASGRDQIGLLRMPPHEVTIVGGSLPTAFHWTRSGYRNEYTPEQVVVFNGYNPLNERLGLSPLYTLRRLLAEEAAASTNREAFWRNSARFEGVIERPKDAPRWTPDQKKAWREQWQERFSGGASAGMTAVLEDGMTYKATSWSAKDSEFVAARKLTREECAAAYHIPPPLVGILDHATFSNIREQHKDLYQDTLGPWLEMIDSALKAQLLPESSDQQGVYVEFNIADKLQGSFEEQASALQALVGRPIMTANEGRARLNLPSLDDPSADTLAAQQGGPAAVAHVTAPPIDQPTAANVALVLDAAARRHRAALGRVAVAERPQALANARDRWTRELTADLVPILRADDAARAVAGYLDRLLAALHREAINDWQV